MNVQEARFRNAAADETSEQLFLDRGSFLQRTATVAAAAAAEAEEVDRDARFPKAAIDAARAAKASGHPDPATVRRRRRVDLRHYRHVLHARPRLRFHGDDLCDASDQGRLPGPARNRQRWHETLMRRVASEQMLLASSTTEGQNGGNIRFSTAAVEHAGTEISLVRNATVISYGAQADGIVTIARRANDAAGSDQVLVAITKDNYTLERSLEWETLGMRGTCSAGFELKFTGSAEQIFPEAYDKIHAQTMTPVAHLCWSSAWAGIAAAAVERAQAVHPQGSPRGRRPDASRRRAFYRGQDDADQAARHDHGESRYLCGP